MPNNEELEKIALKLWCISGREEGFIHHKNLGSSEYIHIMRISAFHIRERDIAVLESRIDELKSIVMCGKGDEQIALLDKLANTQDDRIKELESQLTALKKESEK